MKKQLLTIRTILILTISGLTLLIAFLVFRETYIEGSKLLKIESLQKATLTSDNLFEISAKLSLLRDVTYFMLYADQDTINTLKPQFIENRKNIDKAITEMTGSLKQYNFPSTLSPLEAMQESFAKLKELRLQIDKEMDLPVAKRDRVKLELWFKQITDLILKTQNVWMEFIKYYKDIDPTVGLHLRLKHLLAITMEYTGRERALVGRLIVENVAPTPDEQASLLKWHGAAEMGWERIISLAEQGDLSNNISPYIKDSESHTMNVYDMVRDMFYIPGVKYTKAYPIGIELWLEISTQVSDSSEELKNAVLKETRNYVQTLEHNAKVAIIINFILFAISIILCLYSFWVITFRVLYPINYMVSALIDVTKGKQVSLMPAMIERDDEIGKLGQVLSVLQRSNDRYRALVEASSQIIWTWAPDDQETGMAALHKWWEEITGQPGSEMRDFGWLKVVHPDEREYMRNAWLESSTIGKEFEVEHRLVARSGGYRYVYAHGVPLKNEDGSVREVIGALNDITENKEAELKVKLYMSDLERSNKELDDFAYIASHDLKEPLRGIHNHSRFLLEDNEAKLDKESVDRLNRLVYLSQRMERLVNDLLYFSRLGRQELAIQETDINEVIHDIESTLDVFLVEHKARIVIAKTLPAVTCDKTRVTEVFRNLITNAIKYNDKETRNVEVGFIDECVAIDGTKNKNVFYVKDDGNGIPKEFYSEIFRIFKRLQSPKNKEEQGTGVGLTFVKKIIERHGGKIWLESKVSQGTTFYFTLEGSNNATGNDT